MASNLQIRQKHEDLTKYLYGALRHFPKSEKFTMAADIKRSLIRCLELMIRANKARKKMPLLFDLDVELEVLRTLLRLSMDLGFLPYKKYEYSATLVAEVGRMLGGWIKANKA